MTPVFGIYEANVTDPDGYKEKLLPLVQPKLEKAGVKYLARGGHTRTLVGDEVKNRGVITEASSMDAEMAFWNDADGGGLQSRPKIQNAADRR
jgi:uncharacterized protein (DUF1330 family)